MDPNKAQDPASNAGKEPMPSSEDAESVEAQEDVLSPEQSRRVEGETEEQNTSDSDGELPKEATERTKQQFEKLRKHSDELKRQLDQMRQRAFNEEHFQKTGESKPLYDRTTGLVNVEALEDLQKRALDAEARSRRLEEHFVSSSHDTQVKELYSSYPELKNPKTKEAKDFQNEAERLWLHSQAYPEKYGGDSLTQRQAADMAKKRMGTIASEKEASQVESKEQASLGASGRPTQGVQGKATSEEEQQRLTLGTRLGDKTSMIVRMRAIREANEASK